MADTIECRYCGGVATYRFPNRHAKVYKCGRCDQFTNRGMY